MGTVDSSLLLHWKMYNLSSIINANHGLWSGVISIEIISMVVSAWNRKRKWCKLLSEFLTNSPPWWENFRYFRLVVSFYRLLNAKECGISIRNVKSEIAKNYPISVLNRRPVCSYRTADMQNANAVANSVVFYVIRYSNSTISYQFNTTNFMAFRIVRDSRIGRGGKEAMSHMPKVAVCFELPIQCPPFFSCICKFVQ